MDIAIPGWVQGVIAFVALAIFNFALNVLSNSSTPLWVGVAEAMRTKLSDQRRQVLISQLASVILTQLQPHRALSRMILLSITILITFFGMIATMVAPEEMGRFPSNWPIPSIPDDAQRLAFGVFIVLLLPQLRRPVLEINQPNTLTGQCLKQLEKIGVSNAEAWELARKKALAWTFVPLRNADLLQWPDQQTKQSIPVDLGSKDRS
jgi:hypothetical protein